MTDLRVIPLLCPQCGSGLSGLSHDRVFFCPSCRLGLEPGEKGWNKHPLVFAAADKAPKGARLVYLPLWRFTVSIMADDMSRLQKIALERVGEMTMVWVAGFNQIRPSYYGDIGLAYTKAKVELSPLESPPDNIPMAGCVRDPQIAFRYAELYVTLILDKKSDVTGMEIHLAPITTELWAVPLIDQGEKILDPHTGMTLPAFTIDDIQAIRGA